MTHLVSSNEWYQADAPASLPDVLFHVGEDTGLVVRGPVGSCRRPFRALIRIFVHPSRDVHKAHLEGVSVMFVDELNQAFPEIPIRDILAVGLRPITLVPSAHPVGNSIDQISTISCDSYYSPAFAAPLPALKRSNSCSKLRSVASWRVELSGRTSFLEWEEYTAAMHCWIVCWTLSAVHNRTAGPSGLHVDAAVLVQARSVYVDENLTICTLKPYHT